MFPNVHGPSGKIQCNVSVFLRAEICRCISRARSDGKSGSEWSGGWGGSEVDERGGGHVCK